MTYAIEKEIVGRLPITVVELDLDFCNNTCTVLPCTSGRTPAPETKLTDLTADWAAGTLTDVQASADALKLAQRKVVSLNGTSQCISVPGSAALNLTAAWTLEAWVYLNSAAPGCGIISEIYTGTNVLYELGIGASNGSSKLQIGFHSPAWYVAEDTVNMPTGSWQHVAGTWDGTTLKLYRNGALVASSVPGVTPVAGCDTVFIGRRHDLAGTVNYFPGRIMESRIWGAARTLEQIQSSMYSYLAGNETSLVGYWPIDEASGTTVYDLTSNANNGTTVNAPSRTDVYKWAGNRISPELIFTNETNGAVASWSDTLSGGTDTVTTSFSLDGGTNWSAYAAQTNGSDIPGIPPTGSASFRVKFKNSLTTVNPDASPTVGSFTVVSVGYAASALPVGSECYNTYKSCQDIANYSKGTKTYRFFEPSSSLPVGVNGFPCIVGKPSFTPTKITRDKGLGHRGSVSVMLQDFPHHDRGVDPYVATRTYDPGAQGTFFGKLKARNPYYLGRIMRVLTGYITEPFDWANFQSRTYVIDRIDGPNKKSQMKVTAKDILALADDKLAQAPAPSEGVLAVAMTTASTSITLGTGQGAAYATDPYTESAISASNPGYVRIGDEIIKYTSVAGDVLGGLTRPTWGTVADDHDIDDTVQQCLYYNTVNVVDVLNHLLRKYAALPETFIPYDAARAIPTGVPDSWDDEKSTWLSNNNLTHVVSEPTGVNELISSLTEQNLCNMWWDEINQDVRIKAIAPLVANQDPPTLSDYEHLIRDTVEVKELPKERVSQLWIFYDKIDFAGDDKPDNYRKWFIQVDPNEEANAYNNKLVKRIFADWLDSSHSGLVLTLAGRLLGVYNEVPKVITFTLDARHSDIWTGGHLILDSDAFQGMDGAPVLQKVQVIKVAEKEVGHSYEYEALTSEYEIVRFAFVAPNTQVDYDSASAEEKRQYAFIAPDANGFPTDGGLPYLII